jgi:hypothetical protein
LENQYKVPPFFGLRISITGFEDLEQRAQIEKTVASNGGAYIGDMTRSTTHLLVADANAKSDKFAYARSWKIKTVSLKWFEDSLRRGMALDEAFYLPEMPSDQQGIGAFRETPPRNRTILGKRGRAAATTDSGKHEGNCRRKLRKATSLRLEGQSQDFWQEISAKDVQVDTTIVNAWADDAHASEFADEHARRSSKQDKSGSNLGEKPAVPVQDEGLFSGYCIFPHGFDRPKLKVIRNHIEPNGATLISSIEELTAATENNSSARVCLLIPHDHTSANLPRVPSSTCTITEWWIERCIQEKRALDPNEDMLSRPLPRISDCSNITICMTGFTGVDYRQIARALPLIGFSYQDKLLPTTSLLISGSSDMRKEKAYYAAKHKIPVVSAEWLWSTMRAGRNQPFGHFLIRPSALVDEEIDKGSSPGVNTKADESSPQK